MPKKQETTPRKSDLAAASAANLRANLARRKAQGRGRSIESLSYPTPLTQEEIPCKTTP